MATTAEVQKLASTETIKLSFISVEGNWDKSINDARVDHVGSCFSQKDYAFVIVSGTQEPGADKTQLPFLGARNADRLHERFSVPWEMIVPLHFFPFDFTYTTIEAFGNACVIGWLMSGLKGSDRSCHVRFSPITLGAHKRRVALLNKRACKTLQQFGVFVDIDPGDGDTGYRDDPGAAESEARKVAKLQEPGGLVDTGIWFHGDQRRSLDDIWHMRDVFSAFVKNVCSFLSDEQISTIVSEPSFSNRYLMLQALSFRANTGALSQRNLDFFAKQLKSARHISPDAAGSCMMLSDG